MRSPACLTSADPGRGHRHLDPPGRIHPGAVLAVALVTAVLTSGAEASPRFAPQKPAIMSACTLLTTDEAKSVLGYSAVIARRSRDSVREASRGESRCVFRAPPGSGGMEMVTVYVENGLKPMDQAALNSYASSMALGDSASTFPGLGVTASSLHEPPTIVARKGGYLVLVSAPTMPGTKTLVAKAIGRLP